MIKRGKWGNRVVLEEKSTLTLIDVDGLGVDRREHVLERLRHQLHRLVVGGKVVQN